MADGTSKPITDVVVGDTVLATDPETGESSPRQVKATHINQDTDLTNLTVQDSNGTTSVINTTDHHPIWNETDQEWTDATDLTPGHKLRTVTGQGPTIVEVDSFTGVQTMYDLTVADIHTYYEGYSRRLKNGGLSGVSGCDDGPSSLGESSYYNQIPEQENGPPPCIIRQGSPGLRYKR